MIKQVLITGAADGLGWALTNEYWNNGYHVHLLDKDKTMLEERAEQLEERCSLYVVDLLDDAQFNDFCDKFREQKTNLNLLINNAGITHRSKANDTDLDVFDRVMQLNWRIPVHLTRKLLPALRQANGKVICMSSMAALMPVPGRAAYCASKSALNQHFETWRPELLKQNVALLLVFPSFVATSIEKNAIGADGKQARQARSKIGEVMTAEKMAKSIIRADTAYKERLYSSQFPSRIGSWLWFLLPKVFQRASWRQFSGELD